MENGRVEWRAMDVTRLLIVGSDPNSVHIDWVVALPPTPLDRAMDNHARRSRLGSTSKHSVALFIHLVGLANWP